MGFSQPSVMACSFVLYPPTERPILLLDLYFLLPLPHKRELESPYYLQKHFVGQDL
jgi:hypothetical protein